MTDTHHVKLTIDLAVGENLIDLRYRLSNFGPTAIGVFDQIRVPTIDGTLWYDPDAAYIDFTDGELHVQKVYLTIPSGLSAAEKPMPEVSRLDAGQTLDAHIFQRVPVRVMNPYQRALLVVRSPRGTSVEPIRPAPATSVRFSIGSFPIEEGMKLSPVSPAYRQVLRVFPPTGAITAQVITSATKPPPRPIAVLDYDVAGP